MVLLGLEWGGVGAAAQSFVPLQLRPINLQPVDSIYRQAVATHDSLLLAEAYYLYGKRYAQAGNNLVAKSWFLRSLRIQELRGDSYEYGRLYLRLADLEAAQWHTGDALRYARQARAIFARIHHFKGQSMAFGTLARIHLGNSPVVNSTDSSSVHVDSAYQYLRQAEQWASLVDDPLLRADVDELLGKVLVAKRRPEGIQYFERGVAIHRQYSSLGKQIRAILNLASAYLTLGQPKAAHRLLMQVRQLYTDQHHNEFDTRQQNEEVTQAYYAAIGNWKQAYLHQNRLHQIEKSGLIADRNGAISRLSVEFETRKREARLQAQQRELALDTAKMRTQQWLLIALGVLLSGTVVLSAVFFRLYRQNKRIGRRNAELVQEQNHRVKNNLQVVSSLLSLQSKRLTDAAARKAVEESRLRVQSMAILHRRLYDGANLAQVNVGEFIRELVEGVLTAYGFPFAETQFTIDAISLVADKAVPLGLILNELTTNACKYAFVNNDNPCLSITFRQQANKIHMTVSDNGPGLDGPGLEGFGLEQSDTSDSGPEQSDSLGPGLERVRAPLNRSVSAGPLRIKSLLDRSGEKGAGRAQSVATRATATGSSFGMQLIQAQVDQLSGTSRFVSANGTVFTLTFTV